MNWVPVALLVARLVTGGLLTLAGFSKVALGPVRQLQVVRAYRLLPETWSRPVATALPPIEMVIGASVVLGIYSQGASLLALLVLAVVTGAAGSALVRGIKAPCGCFGNVKTLISWKVVARNVVLMAALVPVIRIGGGGISLDTVPSIRSYVVAAVAAAVVVLATAQLKGAGHTSLREEAGT